MLAAAALVLTCLAIDGDTLRCTREDGAVERIRLSGIDAPETSRCRPERRCVQGDGAAARRQLADLVEGKRLKITRLGKDRYGRTIAAVYVGRRNVACTMLARRQAVYRSDWDNRGVVARDCKR